MLSNARRVENYNGVKNQFLITDIDGVYFQSYESIIVFDCHKEDKIYLDKTYWDYSQTTGKYRNMFLGETKKETEAKIRSGEYILTDLNSKVEVIDLNNLPYEEKQQKLKELFEGR